jgi:hypothetical protein
MPCQGILSKQLALAISEAQRGTYNLKSYSASRDFCHTRLLDPQRESHHAVPIACSAGTVVFFWRGLCDIK